MTQTWSTICAAITAATGQAFDRCERRAVGGGCINDAYVLSDRAKRYFVKLNDAQQADMFSAEAEGLQAIRTCGAIRAPEPICWGDTGHHAYLVLEYLQLGTGNDAALALAGRQLAALHRNTSPHYGWHRHNTIGATPQINTPANNWAAFWRDHRLKYQLELAARNSYGGSLQAKGERLLNSIAAFFAGYTPVPSLLHGDLWSGNFAVTMDREPVIYDPAVYYGDREADLAMTELFGGFGRRFYAAYSDCYPLDEGYAIRKTLYNLYHVLNHLNLFGAGYRGQAERMIDSCLSEIGA